MQPNEAYPAEQNLPTRRSASSQCNERFRQQHTFPFPQQSCSLPTGHRDLGQAALHQPKNHSQTPKGQELLETAVPLRLVWESNISHQWKERKKKTKTKTKTPKTKKPRNSGEERKTRPGRDRWRNKPRFSAMGSSNISCPRSEQTHSTSFPPEILKGD